MQDVVFFISSNIILIGLWFFFLILAIFFIFKNIFLKYKIINNIQTINLINQENAIVIDTRSSELFKKGHIVNSINISLKNIFLKNIEEIEKYKSFPIILILNETYGYNKCIKKLLEYGFNYVYVLKNGIHSWNVDHLPLISKDK